jgi:hypothetical protein
MDIDEAQQALPKVVYELIDLVSDRTGVPIETKPRVCVVKPILDGERDFLKYKFEQRGTLLESLLRLEQKFPGSDKLSTELEEARSEFDSAKEQYEASFWRPDIDVGGICLTPEHYIGINELNVIRESGRDCKLTAAHEAGHYVRETINADLEEPHHIAEFFAEVGTIIYAASRKKDNPLRFARLSEAEAYVDQGLLQEDDLKHLIVKIAIGENYEFIKNNWPDIFNMSTDAVQEKFFGQWLSDFEKKAVSKK